MKKKALFGMVLIIAVLAWDADAMIPHIQMHSWLTLGYVAIFFVGHLVDYLTVGRLINRMQVWAADQESEDFLEYEFLKNYKGVA